MRFRRRALRNGVAAAGVALTMALTPATPAAASTDSDVRFDTGQAPAGPEQPVETTGEITRMTPVPANGRVSCYGYYGTFKAGTEVMVVDWATSSDECFGIATDRTIWHTWPGSGGWTPMPGNGHADYIYPFIDEDPDGYRVVVVHIPSAPRYWWCQNYYPSVGWTGDWYDCTP
ncbi:MAG: hypothetical protein WBA97_23065 [Actinophytocola sp.]|uniref:hypothetical protein n=1 Tax=Actinophytocola sp. TaxID=1872138 RepID=UPI003C78A89D